MNRKEAEDLGRLTAAFADAMKSIALGTSTEVAATALVRRLIEEFDIRRAVAPKKSPEDDDEPVSIRLCSTCREQIIIPFEKYSFRNRRSAGEVKPCRSCRDYLFSLGLLENIEALGLDERQRKVLHDASIDLLIDLVQYRKGELSRVFGVGPQTVREVQGALARRNLALGMRV